MDWFNDYLSIDSTTLDCRYPRCEHCFAFVSPIALANMAENAAGGHFAVAGEFSNMFVIAGGSGATLGLCLYIAFASKSEQLKAIGRASVVPALFNINEPLILDYLLSIIQPWLYHLF